MKLYITLIGLFFWTPLLQAYEAYFFDNNNVKLTYNYNDILEFQADIDEGRNYYWRAAPVTKLAEGNRARYAAFTKGNTYFKTPIFAVPEGRTIEIFLDIQFWHRLGDKQPTPFFSDTQAPLKLEMEELSYGSPRQVALQQPNPPKVSGQSIEFFLTYKVEQSGRRLKLNLDKGFSDARGEIPANPSAKISSGDAMLYVGNIPDKYNFTFSNRQGSGRTRYTRVRFYIPQSMNAAIYKMRIVYK
jgi:hypothetical protein